MTAPDASTPKLRAGRWRWLVAGLIVALLLTGVAVRYAPLVPGVRHLIERQLDGLRVNRLGTLNVEGLSGDLWRDLSARRVTLRDQQGVWLEARNVRLLWSPGRLLSRRFDAERIEVQSLRVFRQPVLLRAQPQRDLPVSIRVGRFQTQLFLEPAFARQRGQYAMLAKLDWHRRGQRTFQVQGLSELRAGDRFALDFALSPRGALAFTANANEIQGGALAGAIGLPVDRPFRVNIRAQGAIPEGRFVATVMSGTTMPLKADGAWAPTGGQAQGRIDLTASRLTAALAIRLGAEAGFKVSGRSVREGWFDLDGELKTEALTARAWGRGDLGRGQTAPEGLQISIAAPSLGRIAGRVGLGECGLQGRVTGQMSQWRFIGTGTASQIALGGYGLARVAGPVEFSHAKGGFGLRMKLSGSGGQGSGFAAALLGGAPTAAIEGERLSNGQLMLRRLDVVGRGLRFTASGGRTLLGAVDLKGQAQISNLAAARPNAAGSAIVEISASQARGEAPWNLTLEAKGKGLAFGLAELDRLAGRSPRLQAQGSWSDDTLTLRRAQFDGAAFDGSASGMVSLEAGIDLDATWSASGPFRAGPLEIAGQVKGTGQARGAFGALRLDLVALIDQIDVPQLPLKDGRLTLTVEQRENGAAASVALVAASTYGPARARSELNFVPGGVDLTDLALEGGGLKAAGDLSLRRRNPSTANLKLNVGPGAFLDAGEINGAVRIVESAAGPSASLDLRAESIRLRGSSVAIRQARITADGLLAKLPYALQARGASGQGSWTVDGGGYLREEAQDYLVTLEGRGVLGGRDLHTTEPAAFRFGGPERTARVRLTGSDGGQLSLDGKLQGDEADVRAKVTAMGLNLFDSDFDGLVDASLVLQGREGRLTGAMDAKLRGARGRGTPAAQGIDGVLKARLAADALTLDLVSSSAQGLAANATVTLPTESSVTPLRLAIARQRPMQGRFFAEGEVRPLWELAIGGERALSGFVHTEGTIAGTLSKPEATGRITVARGRFDDGSSGLTLREVTLAATFNQDAVSVTEARGVDGRSGQLSGQGRISLAPNGVSSFKLDLRAFRLIDNETAVATATGQATINRAADGKVKLSGDLSIDRADVAADPLAPSGVVAMEVREVNRPEDLPVAFAGARKRGQGWALDINLKAPRRVFLRGRGLDMELALDAHVGGTTANSNLTGTARVIRGDYDFAGKRFAFDQTGVVFLSSKLENVRLQLDAVREDPSLRVTVRIRGTAAKPDVTLASSPSLPNDEILSKVLFERSASQLSPVEAAQLASALSSLTGGSGLDVIGNLRSFAGLDRLAFGGADLAGVTVSGGKYLTDDVYIELTGGGRGGPSAQVEWRIRKNLSILSRLSGQSGNRIAVRWRKDY